MSTANKTSEPKRKPVQTSTGKNFIALVKTLQFAWFAGHATTLLCTAFCFVGMSETFYRIAYLGVLESFGIITYQHYFLKRKSFDKGAISPAALVQNGDVLYFALAFLWFVTPRFSLSLIPYAMFSLFHVLIYLKSILLPEVLGLNTENSKLVSFIANYVRNYNERCMYWVGSIELGLLFSLFVKAVLCYQRSWILLVAYSLFIKIRYENSKYMKAAFGQWRVRLDGVMSHPSIPLVVKQLYNKSKSSLIRLSQIRLSKVPVAAEHAQKTE